MKNNNLVWKLTVAAVIAVALWELGWYLITPRMVDKTISDGLAQAEREMYEIVEHLPETRRKVVIVREKTAREVLSMSGDALAARALERAELYRGRLIASADIR